MSAAGAPFPGYLAGQFYLGMSCPSSCATEASKLGTPFGIHRQFAQWGDWSRIAKFIKADHTAGRLPWVSFKPPGGNQAGWQAIASGKHDAELRALAEVLKANDNKPVWLTFHHEPNNDGSSGAVWAAAYCHIHDVLKAAGALANVADPPILSDWLFDPRNPADPSDWLTKPLLQRVPLIGVDAYQNASGQTLAVRLPRVLDWLAAQGYPNKMVAIGETGATDYYRNTTAVNWLNASLGWIAAHTNEIAGVSYFNSTANSRGGVYWPLSESAAKMAAYRTWLNSPLSRN
jgi:hypothetical protein